MDIPPEKVDSLFNFTDTGYETNFSTPRGTSMSEVRAAIVGMELERDYLKHCEEYVVGFNQYNLQIIRHGCVYGGIRDLNVYLDVLSHFRDIPAYIKQTYAGQKDVFKTIRGWGQDTLDLNNVLKGWLRETPKDLPIYLKQGYSDELDLFEYIKSFEEQQVDLRNTVRGWSTGNIVDIINTIRIWHKEEIELPNYIKSTIRDELDLLTIVYKIWQHQHDDIGALLHGWQEVQLQKIIQPLHISDLPVQIRSTYLFNLNAFLYAIQPVDIPANVIAWAYHDLPISIVDGPHPGDFPANIFGVGPFDLPVSIHARKGLGIIYDLNARLTNLSVQNLILSVNPMQYFDLNVLLASSRDYANLTLKIYPKVVNVKYNINVSFLEHRDLAGIINFPCFGSAFSNLMATVTVKNSKDMRMFIYGYDYSNIANLRCSINASDYLAQDAINVKYFANKLPITSHATVRYTKKSVVHSFNTINTWTNTFTRSISDLKTMIIGDYMTKDLAVSIRAYSNRHYYSPGVEEKFITLKLKNNQEDFRRYVELTFDSFARSYSYFSGGKKAYRDNVNDHWIIRVEGHKLLPVGRGFEKSKVKRKYIFNLRNYPTVDDAIKDMIDRVTQMKYTDLNAFIESTNDRVTNLGASLRVKRIYKTNRIIRGVIKGGATSEINLVTRVIPMLFKDSFNLTGSITGKEVIDDAYGVVDFEFLGTGNTPPTPIDADFEFIPGDSDGDN